MRLAPAHSICATVRLGSAKRRLKPVPKHTAKTATASMDEPANTAAACGGSTPIAICKPITASVSAVLAAAIR